MKTIELIIVVLATSLRIGSSQGFVNLDFELADLSAYGTGPAIVPAASAIPGWTAYLAGAPQANIVYNAIALDSAAVSIHGAGSLEPVLQGKYSVFLQGASYGTTDSAAIGQVGRIPDTAKSMTFYGYSLVNMQLTFGEANIPYFVIGGGPNYTIYGADVSGFAGEMGQLLFTAPASIGGGMIDYMRFSNQPVPEPGLFEFSALGALLLGWHRLRRPK
jgi:hypothetical protein